MRCLAIGDIHGCFTALTTLAKFVPFRADDLVVTLGDHINRGPNAHAVIDWLIERDRAGQLIALRGNHEVMMLAAREDANELKRFLEVGGKATLASYSHLGDAGTLADVPESHWQFLAERTRPWFENETHFFVHANVYPEVELEEQPDFMLYWEQFRDPPPHISGKIMVCGHTPQRSGWPRSIGHAVCIDTSACRGGWLTCLDVGSGRYWQANESQETRQGWLDDLS